MILAAASFAFGVVFGIVLMSLMVVSRDRDEEKGGS